MRVLILRVRCASMCKRIGAESEGQGGSEKKGNREWTEKQPTGKTICPIANHTPQSCSHSI